MQNSHCLGTHVERERAFLGGRDKVYVTLTCTLLDIPSWFFMYGVYGFVRVSAVNELEGEVEVAYYSAAVTRLSIVVPFCLLLL